MLVDLPWQVTAESAAVSFLLRGFLTLLSLAVAATVFYSTLFLSDPHPGWARAAGLFGGLTFTGTALMFAKHGSGDAQERFGRSVMVVCLLMFVGILIANMVLPDLFRHR